MLTRCGFNQRVRQLIGFMFLKFEHFSIHIGEVIKVLVRRTRFCTKRCFENGLKRVI